LSEVEALCDRVAMLHSGRIIEIGRLDVLRSLAKLRVRAEGESPVPDLSGLDGISNVSVDGRIVECDVAGSMQPLLRVLAESGINRLTTREPSLEELFMSQYGEGHPAFRSGR
jgi:ABC-2 type transport system ATP-binding protein